jgi:neopullulanase
VDNHDLVRFMTSVGEDPAKFKLGIVFLLTTRGIPQIYYGTEIMKMGGANDPDKRRLFPGGWPHHEINAFTEEGRRQLGEKRGLPIPEVFDLVKKLSEWRKGKDVIHTGALTHFIPYDNVYVFFRHNDNETVMVMLNGDNSVREINMARFNEFLDGYHTAIDIISGGEVAIQSAIHLNPRQAMILELK